MSKNSENYGIDLLSLNDSQLIKIVSKVTVPVDYSQEILNSDLLEISEKWSELAKICREEDQKESYANLFKGDFTADMNAASEFFSEKFGDRLGGDGEFANYVKSFVDNNLVQCHDLAALFFKCLCYIETKTAEEKEQYFLQFPPISGDLNCLDGTFERVSQTYLRLTVKEKSQPLLDVHERVLFSLVDRLKDHVRLANHVHIPGYLSKIFDFSESGPIHPESQISTAELWGIYCDYPAKFKSVISGRERIEKIEKDFPGINLNYFDIENSKLIKAIQENLESFSEFSKTGFLEEADDDGKFLLVNFSSLSEAASKMPAIVALRDFVNDEDVLSLADKMDDENGLLEKLKNPSKISPETTIFSEDFVQNFISLLMRANSDSANPQDLIFATKLLSIMSNYHLINSSYNIVKRVLDIFNEVELRPELTNAIELARESSAKFARLNHVDSDATFVTSLITNPTTEELIAAITGGVDLPMSDDQDYQKAALNLIYRPDSNQIFDALKTRIGKDISTQNNKFIDQCFVNASAFNKVDLCKKIDADFLVSNELSIANGLIFQAAVFGMVEMAKFLTDRAIQKNETIEFSLEYENSLTPAAGAAYKGKDNILRVFYQSGLDHELINTSCGELDYTPIDWAVAQGNNNVIKLFFESDLGIRPNDEQIIKIIRNAAAYGQDHILRYLHDKERVGLDLLDYKDDGDYSAIEFATLNNHPEVIKQLISYGVPFNQTYENGSSLLHIAAINDHTNQAIEFLCNQGLDPNYKNEEFDTALHVAINHGAIGAIEILGQFGADPMQRNRSNETAIDLAVTINNDEALIALLAISNRDTGNSFLHEAIYDESKREVLRNLADAGVSLRNFNPKNYNDETPLVLAAINKDSEFISIMQSIGVDLYCEDENGFTTITHLAHLQTDVPMVDEIGEIEEALDFWLSLGVDINHPNHRGLSPARTLIEGLSYRVGNVNGILLLSKYSDLLEENDRDYISNMSARLKELFDAKYVSQEYQSNEEKNSETEFDVELTPSSSPSSMEPEEKLTPRTTPSIDSQAKQLADRGSESDKKI